MLLGAVVKLIVEAELLDTVLSKKHNKSNQQQNRKHNISHYRKGKGNNFCLWLNRTEKSIHIILK